MLIPGNILMKGSVQPEGASGLEVISDRIPHQEKQPSCQHKSKCATLNSLVCSAGLCCVILRVQLRLLALISPALPAYCGSLKGIGGVQLLRLEERRIAIGSFIGQINGV